MGAVEPLRLGDVFDAPGGSGPAAPVAESTRRAFRSIVRRPIVSNSCSTSKLSMALSRGSTSSSSVRSRGMSHWRFPRSKMSDPPSRPASPGRSRRRTGSPSPRGARRRGARAAARTVSTMAWAWSRASVACSRPRLRASMSTNEITAPSIRLSVVRYGRTRTEYQRPSRPGPRAPGRSRSRITSASSASRSGTSTLSRRSPIGRPTSLGATLRTRSATGVMRRTRRSGPTMIDRDVDARRAGCRGRCRAGSAPRSGCSARR